MSHRTWIAMAAMFLTTILSHTVTAQQPATDWVNISDPVIQQLDAAGTKIPWPGQTSGVTCDRVTGQVYIEVAGVGLWTSTDHGATFTRLAGSPVGGRCEYGYALNFDPAGHRLACFMLDGKGGLTLDGGKTWSTFADVGRNWDYGAVDWSDPAARTMFLVRHESGGELYLTTDAGASWKKIGTRPQVLAVAIFDDHTLALSEGDGILRSTDAGQTWTRVADQHPVGRVAVPFQGATYWLAKEGLLVTRDKGATWQTIGTPSGAGWGPLFGADAQHLIVADPKGFLRTADGGATWQRVADLPPNKEFASADPGHFLCIAWDPQANILYASRMANPTYKLQLK